jgi:competence protein ComEA
MPPSAQNDGKGWGPMRGYVVLSLLWLGVLGGVVYYLGRPAEAPFTIVPPPATFTPAPSPTPRPLRVDVTGAVMHPDVYVLPPDSIVRDAVRAAGGPTEDADLSQVNQATPLHDGMQVYVPRRGETVRAAPTAPSPRSAPTSQPAPASRVNINTASAEELETLPGIGPVMAQRIIAGRPYASVEEILRVPGLGPATFEKIKNLITTE